MKEADRVAGVAMIAAAAGALLAMGHHPSGAHGGSALAGIVHASMIALLGLLIFGFTHMARRRGLDRPAVLAGLLAYGIALFGHVGAATINGFVVPALAARGVTAHDLFLFAWEMNQALAKLGVYATSAAYLFWSAELIGEGRTRLLGALGLVAAILPASLLASGAIRLDVTGAFISYAVQVGWAALVGLHLLRHGALAPERRAD
ncbi:MAG TPA: hypothetical protein VEW25_10255 [Allosphingosinicella sp.]|nr:hypothetical protein [Allosphingosinicella sp.]